ncbi:hypothetical protein BH10ACI2_BH10ACI2_03600 [soil metagenome]
MGFKRNDENPFAQLVVLKFVGILAVVILKSGRAV